MNNPLVYLASVPSYLGWFAICIVLLIAFGVIYCLITPKSELKMIREGNLSVSISLVGSLIGFTVMMAAVMMNASSRGDLIMWTLFGLLIQLAAYFSASILLGGVNVVHDRFRQDNVATGVFVGGVSVCVGLISAAVLAS